MSERVTARVTGSLRSCCRGDRPAFCQLISLVVLLLHGCSSRNSDDQAANSQNLAPNVVVTQPSPGASFTHLDTVEIRVEASDPDGQVRRVSFFANGRYLGQDDTPPYSWLLPLNEDSRWHTVIEVIAEDDAGASTAQSVLIEARWVYQQPDQLGDGWPIGSLADVGMDPAYLENLVNTLRDQSGHLIHGLVIARHGRLVFEKYFDGLSHPTYGERPTSFDAQTRHTLSSVTKSVTATLLGIAIDRGFIDSVDSLLFNFLPEVADLDTGQKSAITLEHMVTMTSGLDWDESTYPLTDPRNDLIQFIQLATSATLPAIRFVMEKPVTATPGTVLRYSGGNTNVLGKAIQNASGMRLDHFADEYLLTPLGIQDVTWWLFQDDFVYASGDISLRPRDLTKIGQLYLQGGIWNGETLLSPEWIAASTWPYSSFNYDARTGNVGYGYGWWIKGAGYGAGAYNASGWGGQEMIILREFDMVVTLTGGSYWRPPLVSPHRITMDYVLPATVTPSTAN
jgi:CubicO group peptidase (beta-lactamase class C family)